MPSPHKTRLNTVFEEAYRGIRALEDKLKRSPSRSYHSEAQENFVNAIKDKLDALVDDLEQEYELCFSEEGHVETRTASNMVGKWKRIAREIAELRYYALNLADLDVFDLPSPLILWWQETYHNVSTRSERILIGRFWENGFKAKPSGLGRWEDDQIMSDAVVGRWPVVLYPAGRNMGIFNSLILYHEMMHALFDTSDFEENSARIAEDAETLVNQYRFRGTVKECVGFINQTLKAWATEFLCDIAAAHVVGPAYLLGMMQMMLSFKESDILELKRGHPPPRKRMKVVRDTLANDENWGECFRAEFRVLDDMVENMSFDEQELEADDHEGGRRQAIKYAYSVIWEEYIDTIRMRASDMAENFKPLFRSTATSVNDIKDDALKNLNDGLPPVTIQPSTDFVNPLDIINCSAAFLLSAAEEDWKSYETGEGQIHHVAAIREKLCDLTLKSVEDVLLRYQIDLAS